MKKKTTKYKNEVLQLTLDELINDIIADEKYIDIFGHCKSHIDCKNGKLITKISNEKNNINMSLDINDIAKHYGYKFWKYIEVVDWDYYGNTIMVDKDCRTLMIQFYNEE